MDIWQQELLCKKKLSVVAVSLALTACGGGGGGGNTAPAFGQSTYDVTLSEDTDATGSAAATDADGNNLGYSISTPPENGTLVLQQDGAFTYTPNANYFGSDSAVIAVSDSIASVTATLNFTVENVNDLPIVQTTSVAVSSTGETQGVVEATDADGDALTYSVAAQPTTGNVVINGGTGAFTYTSDGLNNAPGSFDVSVSDGVGEAVVATIDLGASYVSNADKSNYYYASSHSQLTKAEQYITSQGPDDNFVINDTAVSDEIYVDIAVGYAQAGLTDLVAPIIENNILRNTEQADAYRQSALAMDELGNTALALQYRQTAVARYNEYIAQIGIDNIASSDTGFFQSLINNHIDAGDLEGARNVMNITRIYSQSLEDQEAERSIASLRLATAAQGLLDTYVTTFIADPTSTNFDNAMLTLDYFVELTERISFNVRRGENNYLNRTNSLVQATRAAYLMSFQGTEAQRAEATDRAKTLLARSIAMYTDANYDPDYTQAAEQYAQNTLTSYPSGISLLSGPFAGLYPEYIVANVSDTSTGNIPLDLVIGEEGLNDSDTRQAYRDHYAYTMVVAAGSGNSISPVIDELVNLFTTNYPNDMDDVVEALVEQDAAGDLDKRAAWLLSYLGNTSAMEEAVLAAFDTLESDIYFEDIGHTYSRNIGSEGCSRFADVYRQLGGNDATYTSLITRCLALVDSRYGNDSDSSDVNKMNAWINAAVMQQALGNQESVVIAMNNAKAAAEAILPDTIAENDDYDDLLGQQVNVINAYFGLDFYPEGLEMLNTVLADASSRINAEADLTLRLDIIEDLISELGNLVESGTDNNYLNIDNALFAIRKQAGLRDDYATTLQAVIARTKASIDEVNAQTDNYSDNEKADLYEDLIDLYLSIGDVSSADLLAASPIFGDTDREELIQTIAESEATRDDFPASSVATVDTDLDGLPNFFRLTASEQAIAESGLTIDDDADNDGILDPADVNPLEVD